MSMSTEQSGMYVCMDVCMYAIQQRTISIRASRMHDGYGMVRSMYCMTLSRSLTADRQTNGRSNTNGGTPSRERIELKDQQVKES